MNARGREIEIGADDRQWLGVVVIDHPSPPEDLELELKGSTKDLVVLLRRDWEFLFDQLKSTHAVVEYLRRVSGEIIELGSEPLRYYDLAQADAEAEPDPVDPALLGGGRFMFRRRCCRSRRWPARTETRTGSSAC